MVQTNDVDIWGCDSRDAEGKGEKKNATGGSDCVEKGERSLLFDYIRPRIGKDAQPLHPKKGKGGKSFTENTAPAQKENNSQPRGGVQKKE